MVLVGSMKKGTRVSDNLDDIKENFECRQGDEFAGGYAYFCKRCDTECNVGEIMFHCQGGRILPVYIFCRYGCGKSWKLQICPVGEVEVQ